MPLLRTILRPFAPPFHTIAHYNAHKLRKDLLAGLTVSVVEVPQAMAYALIAGVPAQYGLYTSILQGIVGALLSSSEHMTTGPTNTQALLTASAGTLALATVYPQLTPGTDAYGMQYLEIVFCLTLLKGIIQLIFAAARMGDMVRYVSRSVIAGLTAGAGVLIIVGQLGNFLGVKLASIKHPWPGVTGAIERLWPALGTIDYRAVILAVISLALAVVLRRISKLIPGALIAVIVASAIVWIFGWLAPLEAKGAVIGNLPKGFSHFHVPHIDLTLARTLFTGAAALAILGMIESVAIAKSIAAHTGEDISANQEFFAQGLKNTLTSFFQCIPGSGSFTRSALDYAAGAETRFAAVFNAVCVAAIYFLLRGEARYIPLASLAAILWVVAWSLFDFRYIARISRTSRTDTIVFFITFLATVFAPLEYAIFIGVFLNLAIYLHASSHLRIAEMIPPERPEERFREVPLPDRTGERRVMLLQPEGSLFFGLADELADHLARLAISDVRIFVIRLKRVPAVDATVLSVLERFIRDVQARNGYVLLCGVRPDLAAKLRSFGIIMMLGEQNFFPAEAGTFDSTRRALDRAAALNQSSIDASAVAEEDDSPEPFTYEI